MMSKKILMLTSTWDSDYSRAIIAGILERIGDDDVILHIFNDYDGLTEPEYFQKGREIYSLPDLRHYDGLIVALSTVESVKYVSNITARFHEQNKPIVSIDTQAEGAIFCGLDNYRSMYQIVEHMITIHDCRTINYLGGPVDNSESKERYRAFRDCLEAHGIKVQPKRVLHKRFWKKDGNEAYREWKELGVNMADCVICANDYMALGYVEEASKDGITVPDYIKVTGFDNIEEAHRYSPSITSVNRNRKLLGYEAMDALMEALAGNSEYDTRFVEGFVNYNESCGCDLSRDIRADYNDVIRTTKRDLDNSLRHGYIRQWLTKSNSMDELGSTLSRTKEFFKICDLAVCVNSSFPEDDPEKERIGYDDKMVLYTDEEKAEIDRNEQLYPLKWIEEHKVFLFSSLRNSRQTYGYMVMPYESDFFTRNKHMILTESMSLAVENINYKTIKKNKTI